MQRSGRCGSLLMDRVSTSAVMQHQGNQAITLLWLKHNRTLQPTSSHHAGNRKLQLWCELLQPSSGTALHGSHSEQTSLNEHT